MDGVDASNFNSLYLSHFRALFDTTYRIIGIDTVADQIAQDVLLEAWQSAPVKEPAGRSFASHLRLAALQRAIDWACSNSTRSQRELQLVQDPDADGAAATVALGHHSAWDALAALPAQHRQSVVLAFYGGMSYREVAAHLQIPEATVKERIHKGMQALASQVKSTKVV